MIPEKYLMPSDESIRYFTKRVEVFSHIIILLKYLMYFLLPVLILLYKKTSTTEYLLLLFGFLSICVIWVLATRKRNLLKLELSLHNWLFELLKYPDKIQHDKYFSDDTLK